MPRLKDENKKDISEKKSLTTKRRQFMVDLIREVRYTDIQILRKTNRQFSDLQPLVYAKVSKVRGRLNRGQLKRFGFESPRRKIAAIAD